MKGDKERALQAGCDDYLSKPLSLNELKEKVNRLVVKNEK
jgi:CheY-like chemotaxis protein